MLDGAPSCSKQDDPVPLHAVCVSLQSLTAELDIAEMTYWYKVQGVQVKTSVKQQLRAACVYLDRVRAALLHLRAPDATLSFSHMAHLLSLHSLPRC